MYANTGEWEKAIQEYTKSIQLNPEDSHVHLNYYNRGWAYYKCNRIEDALVDIEKAVQIVPDDEDYLRGLEVVKNSSKGDIDIAFIQHEIKILLICSGICAAIGIIIGIISCGGYYGDGQLLANIFLGIWIGAGVGAILEYIRAIPAVFSSAVKEEDLERGLKVHFLASSFGSSFLSLEDRLECS
ncbi:hypothetical protein AGMMS50293_05260 [Spirochaetia bacterium]|nr:hypothetical protein AGMMS50293_05260 [Spirochaetia bacterium]